MYNYLKLAFLLKNMLNFIFKRDKAFIFIIFIFLLLSDFKSYKMLYGEDAIWINQLLSGNIVGSLFPRENFFVLGATLPQVVSVLLTKTLAQYGLLKYFLSYLIILFISFSNYLNNFLNKNFKFLLTIFCILPLSSSVDFEVYGHLHNLVWYYPIFTLNLFIFLIYETNFKAVKVLNIKLINFIYLIFLLSSFLFPICLWIVILAHIFLIVFKTTSSNYFLFNNGLVSFFVLLAYSGILLNISDREGTILPSNALNIIDFSKYYEFFLRLIGEPFISIFTYEKYFGSAVFAFLGILLVISIILYIYLDTVITNLIDKRRFVLTRQSFNIFLLVLLISYYSIFSLSRFSELSYFLNGFLNSGYPERYYITTNYLSLIVIFTILFNRINFLQNKNLLIYEIPFSLRFSKLSFYKISLRFFSCIILFLIVFSTFTRFAILLNNSKSNNFNIHSNCTIKGNKLIIDGYPDIFKTLVPKDHKYFDSSFSLCNFK